MFAPAVFQLPIVKAYDQKMTIVYGGALFDSPGSQVTAAQQWLRKEFPAQASNPPALLGWQAAYLFYEAMAKAVKSGSLARGSIRDALATLNIPSQGLGPGQLTFSPSSKTPVSRTTRMPSCSRIRLPREG